MGINMTAQIDDLYPQTTEELMQAKALLSAELEKRGLSGVPSEDRVWKKWYTPQQLSISAPQKSLSDYIYEKNKDPLDSFAMNYLGKRITYAEIFSRIEDTAKRFQKYGIKEGDYVSLALPVTPEAVYMIYGLDMIGGCASLIDPRVSEERMEYYLDLLKSRFVGITGIYASTVRKAIKRQTNMQMINIPPLQSFSDGERLLLRTLYKLKTLGESSKEAIFNLAERGNNKRILNSRVFYRERLRDEKLYIPPYKTDRTAIVEFTSGTTGIPKGLELSAASINLVVAQLFDLIKPQAGDTMLGIMPPFISYGMVCGVHAGLSSGFEIKMIPNFSPEAFPALVLEHKPNMIICVPNFLQRLMNSPLVNEETDLSFIKYLIVGGDKMNVAFELKFREWLKQHNCNTSVTKGGGMAKYGSCLFYTPFEKSCKPGVYGLPLPSVDANSNELGYYEVGEIHISSAQGMNGYVNNPEATEQFFYYDGKGKKYGRSGDLGYVDINGIFTLLDRKKQMIIRPDGHNVFPSEICAVINQHPSVVNCVVAGIKENESDTGVWPTAFIQVVSEYTSRPSYALNEIKKLCAKKLPPRDRPRDSDYVLVKEIVTTTEGKVNICATTASQNRLR